jgi:glycosyltransferase involved in cell wall biosynthesis
MSTVNRPLLSIVICTWNRAPRLRRTLASLLQSEASALSCCEVLVVDNRSTDATRDTADAYVQTGAIRYVLETNPGLSHARNRGVTEATGQWILFLDDDVLVAPTFLANYLAGMAAHAFAGYFGGPVRPLFDGATRAWTSAVMTDHPWIYSCLDLGPLTRPFMPGQIPFGANMCIRRDLLLDHPFSPELGYRHGALIPGEEAELFAQLQGAGIAGVWLADCALQHCLPEERNSLRYLVRRAYGQGRMIGRNSALQGRSTLWAVRDAMTAICKCIAQIVLKPRCAVGSLVRLSLDVGVLRGYRPRFRL